LGKEGVYVNGEESFEVYVYLRGESGGRAAEEVFASAAT
jgi:hypothetical protein